MSCEKGIRTVFMMDGGIFGREKEGQNMIALIDYDAGNIRSVEKALRKLGQEVCVTRDKAKLLCADHVILPGVGAFGDAMEHLKAYGLAEERRFSVFAWGFSFCLSAATRRPE